MLTGQDTDYKKLYRELHTEYGKGETPLSFDDFLNKATEEVRKIYEQELEKWYSRLALEDKGISKFCGFEDIFSKISDSYHMKDWGVSKERYMEQARTELFKGMESWIRGAKDFDNEN